MSESNETPKGLVLTDREKLIISALYIQKQVNLVVDFETRNQMIKDYSISLDSISNPIKIYDSIKIEEMNFITILSFFNTAVFYELIQSDFNNQEKFILYETELALIIGKMPFAVKAEFSTKLSNDLAIKNNLEVLKAIKDQINTIYQYMNYYLSNSKKT